MISKGDNQSVERGQKLAQSSPRHCGCQGHCRGAEEEEEEEAQEDSGGDC